MNIARLKTNTIADT